MSVDVVISTLTYTLPNNWSIFHPTAKNVNAIAHLKYDKHMDGLAQDYSNPSANALELLQSYAKPSISGSHYTNILYHMDKYVICLA